MEWLNTNAGALQALTTFIGLLLTAVTIVVLVITVIAVRAQAAAAMRLTASTDTQIDILKEQLMATRRQTEEAVRPMLEIPVGFVAGNGLTKGPVINLGNGPALDVTFGYGRYGDVNFKQEFVVPPVISKNKSFEITIDAERIRQGGGIVFLYRSLTGSDCSSMLVYERPHFRYVPDASEWTRALLRRSQI